MEITFHDILRCPISGEKLRHENNKMISSSNKYSYDISPSGIPLFAQEYISEDAKMQQQHYDKVAALYQKNLNYPHSQEYMAYLDKVFLKEIKEADLDFAIELCCGTGEAFGLLKEKIKKGMGIDVSLTMLEKAIMQLPNQKFGFLQADATRLPLDDQICASVFMLGGIHHVSDREKLFSEIFRILKPGGRFYWREPVDDFFLWRFIRAIIYRVSPGLDHKTEAPLRYQTTIRALNKAGLHCREWKTYGFIGFCLFMNSDILIFNRFFRFIPGIRQLTRLFIGLDEMIRKIPGLKKSGLQVIAYAEKA